MAWDEALFGFAWGTARRLWDDRARPELGSRLVELEPQRQRLETLARLITGRPVGVVLTDDAGGVAGDTFFLPRRVSLADQPALNQQLVLARLAWSAALHGLGLEGQGEPGPLAMALRAAEIRARVLDQLPALAEGLPALEALELAARPTPAPEDLRGQAIEAAVRRALGRRHDDPQLSASAWAWADRALAGERAPLPEPVRRWFRPTPAPAPVLLWGELLPSPSRVRPNRPTGAPPAPSASGTELKARTPTRVERVQEPPRQLHENPLVHSFEKVHTLDTYKGGSKRIDGDDELAAHQKALDELDLRQVVRSHQAARSVYRADLLLDGGVGDLEGEDDAPAEALYDEWDEGRGEWKRRWCRLTTRSVAEAPESGAQLRALRSRLARTTTGLRAVFEQLEAARVWRLRQRSGPDVDVDALVARYGALRAGDCSEDRLYASRRRHSRDTAVLVLLDASLSTDAWVANRRVLDVEKEAVIALGDALDGLFDEVAVAAFMSQSRRDCRFLVAKGFGDGWEQGARRVLSLEPAGFTRIGPAVRHATARLLECGARRRLLLLVSDGKPTDVDRYEGRYGVADVHRAVLEAHGAGVVVHALAVDPAARAWLPPMFGHGRASVVARPDDLVHALSRVTTQALRA